MKKLQPNEVFKSVYRPTIENTHDTYQYVDSNKFSSNKYDLTRMYKILEERIINLFKYIEPNKNNRKTYSYEISSLLVSVCIEVENCFRQVLFGNSKINGYVTMKHYSQLEPLLKLNKYEFKFIISPEWIFKPFKDWGAEKGSLDWYEAYNKVKHDRSTNLNKATLEHLLNEFAGLYALHLSMFGPYATSHKQAYGPGCLAIKTENAPKEHMITGEEILFLTKSEPCFNKDEKYQINDGKNFRVVSAELNIHE